jgi:2-dehydro-3-deoxygluconokinase
MPEVVTLGETMVLFSPEQNGPLRYVRSFQKRIAGAESNVAIGLVRLGHSCGWMSAVGADEFGQFVVREIRAEGVDVSRVQFREEAPTGLMFKEISEGMETRVTYYRKGSAASLMGPEGLDGEYIAGAKILHVTGITPALSQTCLDMVMEAIFIARKNNVVVSFDPNIRLKLWSRERAVEVIKRILPCVDIVFPGSAEGELLFDSQSAEESIDAFLQQGARIVALKMGGDGCWVAGLTERYRLGPFTMQRAVDPIGAGDAFAAGFLAGYLEDRSLQECGKLANAMGAFAVTTPGDIEGLPERSRLEAFIKKETSVAR